MFADAPPPWDRVLRSPHDLRALPVTPGLLTPERIPAEVRAQLWRAVQWFGRFPPMRTVPVKLTRRWIRDGGGPYPARYLSPRAVVLGRSALSPVTCRLFYGTTPILFVHVHGGGFMFGSSDGQDRSLEWVCGATGAHVVSLEYGLAPERPYPEGLEDVARALEWIASHPADLPRFDRWILAGESAGANIALSALCRTRARLADGGPAAMVLSYGFFDLELTPSARAWGDMNLVIDTPTLRWYACNYATPELWSSPDVSPLRAELTGLPPVLLTVGTADPLLDDSLLLASRWRAAGGRSELAVWPGGMHKFDYGDGEPATSARRRMAEFVLAESTR